MAGGMSASVRTDRHIEHLELFGGDQVRKAD
jgi:hypothetical protein